ncbi:hypothetical protein MHU86_22442 [Fragilaria crotonensis]|nr:hypothetical protein MHU86_22442 [Fragilaria crotonensis]
MFAVAAPAAFAAAAHADAAAAAAAAIDAHGAATRAAEHVKVAADHDYATAAAFHANSACNADTAAADAATDAAAAAARGDTAAAAQAAESARIAAAFATDAAAKAAKPAAAARSEQWQRYLRSRSVIGIHTIAWMHTENNCLRKFWMKYLLFLVLVAQAALPILLLLNSLDTFNATSFCDGTANWISKGVAFAIACIYQVRTSFWWERKYHEPMVKLKQVARNRFGLQVLLVLDGFLASGYEYFVSIFNFFVVFATPDPQDMVLNALAFEFILELDDYAKEKYISLYSEDHEDLIQNYESTFEVTYQNLPESRWYFALLRYATSHVVPSFCLFYFPVCKPKGLCKLPCPFKEMMQASGS